MSGPEETGYVTVNHVPMYWESRGNGGTALVVVHGGFGMASHFSDLLDALSAKRRVVAVELQGHGHTADIDRPFSFEQFGNDIAGLVAALDLGTVDLLGNSLGGSACLRAALQHPSIMRRLALVSIPCRRTGWFPEVLAGMDALERGQFEMFKQSPMYNEWLKVAPNPDSFPALMDKTGALLRTSYDWTEEVATLRLPTLLVYGDADSISPAHAAEFFALLGGGLQDAAYDGTVPTAMRLAILPGLSHYTIFQAPELVSVVDTFLS